MAAPDKGLPKASRSTRSAAGHLLCGRGRDVERRTINSEFRGTCRMVKAAYKIWCLDKKHNE